MPPKTTDILDKTKKDDSIGTYVHSRSMRQIAKEVAEKHKAKVEVKEEKPVKTDFEEKVDKVKVEKKEDKKKEREEREVKRNEEIAKKAADEAASKVAEETKKAFDAKVTEILNKDKSLTDKQKEIDELIPVWEKEKRLPKDYPELIKENLRVTEAKWEQKEKEKEAKAAEERKVNEEKEKTNKVELEKKQGEEKLAEFNRQISQDLNDIYDAKMLPRPEKFEEVNNPNTKDENAKATQKVLQFGVELNTRLVKEGKPPVTSLNKIYFLHYKPYIDAHPEPKDGQPAGSDAPVAGANNTATVEAPKDKYIYARDHNKTFSQIASDFKRRMGFGR